MIDKVMIGEVEIPVKFTNWYYSKVLGEESGQDPLTYRPSNNDAGFSFCLNVLYSGLKTRAFVDKTEPKFTKAELEYMLGVLDGDQINSLVDSISTGTKEEGPGESQTQA